VLTDDQSFWRLAFRAGFDCAVTPEQRLEAANAKTIDLFMPDEALNAELSHQPYQPSLRPSRMPIAWSMTWPRDRLSKLK
jgi:hypothetical protein